MATIQMNSCLAYLAMGLALMVGAGCSSQPDLGRQALSGKVNFNGQPLPVGEIQFRPDFDKGNQGPGTHAMIANGSYETPSGKGIIPGPTIVTIVGFDGVPYEYQDGGETIVEKRGRAVFTNYRKDIDIPKGAAQVDFDVPASATPTRK